MLKRKSLMVPLMVVVLAVVHNVFTQYYDSTTCDKDPPIQTSFLSNKNGHREYAWPDSCQLFSNDYGEARDKFRSALKVYDNVEQLTIPIAFQGDNQKEALTIDVAIFPGNAQKYGTIIHSSGVHGVEGYAGSAIQLAILKQKDILLTTSLDDQERPAFVFLHALNPVGMLEYRRCNEHNVDLNRNGLSGEFFRDFIEQLDPNVANYDSFRRFLSPTDPENRIEPSPWYDTIGIWLNLLPQLYRYGFMSLKRAMVTGQYHHPQGIFYGGQELQPSLQRLEEFWESRPDLFRSASSLIWIDVHTGLGPFGKDSLHYIPTFLSNEEAATKPLIAKAFSKRLFSTAYSVTTTLSQDTTSGAFSGYELANGALTSYFAERFNGTGLFVTQEFGTLPAVLVGRGLILDNMLYQQYLRNGRDPMSYRSPFLKYAFYPQSTKWRSSIVSRGVILMLQAIESWHQVNQQGFSY